MLTFMLKSDSAFKLLHFNAKCTILGTVLFFLEKIYLPYLHTIKWLPTHLLKVLSI